MRELVSQKQAEPWQSIEMPLETLMPNLALNLIPQQTQSAYATEIRFPEVASSHQRSAQPSAGSSFVERCGASDRRWAHADRAGQPQPELSPDNWLSTPLAVPTLRE